MSTKPPGWLVFFRGFRDPAEFEPDRPKKSEEYRAYAAGFFAGDTAKGGQGVEII